MGNLNNDIGMPLMLLRIEESHRFAVIEMGANHARRDRLPDIARETRCRRDHERGARAPRRVRIGRRYRQGKGEILCGETRPGSPY